MTSSRETIRRFEPYADHFAFVVSDAGADEGTFDGDTRDDADESWRIAVGQHCIVVGTARYDHVPVLLTVTDAPPAEAMLDSCDHVVEADVSLPSGRLCISGGAELPDEVEPVLLTTVRYRVPRRHVGP
ncbi:hypothetical protein [Actinoplanes sp. OR16]|uniref:hypothetical protein n=1 Tax=Actinoplanes sp. OR16 TaxID=946334 RepID=UPI000FD9B957|nr:hypothetical protein [Actinoplanes sp. OR16]